MPHQDDLVGLIERAWQLELRRIALSTALELASRKLAFYEGYVGSLDQASGALERVLRPAPSETWPAHAPALPVRAHRPRSAGSAAPSLGMSSCTTAATPRSDLGPPQAEQAAPCLKAEPDHEASARTDYSCTEQACSSAQNRPAMAFDQACDKVSVGSVVNQDVRQERLRLAQRIHDGLTQEVTSLVLGLEATQRAMAKDPLAVAEGLAQARQSARSCLSEARRFLAELQSEPPAATGLLIALQRLVEEFRQEEGLPVSFQWSGSYPDVSRDVEHGVLGVVQESLTNAKKHSRAQTIVVSFHFSADAIEGLIFDDGQGFNPVHPERAFSRGDAFGLVSMRQRMDALGGELRLDSAPGKGTRVELRVPLGQGTTFIRG